MRTSSPILRPHRPKANMNLKASQSKETPQTLEENLGTSQISQPDPDKISQPYPDQPSLIFDNDEPVEYDLTHVRI